MSKDFRILIWLRRVIVIAFSLASFNFASATEPTFSQEASEAPIRALHNQMIDAYNRGDATAASSALAPDGALITGDGKRYVTPPEIQRYLTVLLAKLPKGTLFVATVTDVRFAGHDTVVLTSEGGWLYPGETAPSLTKTRESKRSSLYGVRAPGTWCYSNALADPLLLQAHDSEAFRRAMNQQFSKVENQNELSERYRIAGAFKS